MNKHKHGGDLDYLETKYNISKNDLIDFSSNINPLGYPKKAMEKLKNNLDISTTYPDKDYKNLKSAISKYTTADVKNIVVGNGSTELISLFIQTVDVSKSLIIAPSYSEYEHELEIKGGKFEYFLLNEEEDFNLNVNNLLSKLTKDIGLLILCNPNNPTGTVVRHNDLSTILTHCKNNNTAVMIDETYIEFTDDIKTATAIPLTEKFDNLFVIRGTSKFYSLAGIRLGYGVSSSKKFLDLVKNRQNAWSVNHFASFLGEEIFNDTDFQKETINLISTERTKLINEIKTWKNCKVYETASNFILIKILNNAITSSSIYEKCLQEKMVIRDCSSFTSLDETYIRFCIMHPEQNKNLIDILKKILS